MSEQFLYFLQQMFNGVTLGSTYALIAIGYTMVYGIIGMINFAHGEVYMIGSYVSFMIIAALMMLGIDTGWLLVAAGFVGAIVIASAYGWSIERVAYRPVRNSKRLIALISAIGMSIFLQNYVSLTEGSRDVALPSLFNGQWVVGHSENFSASITTMQAVIWIVTFLAMLALTIFIRYSRMGRACRACAEDLKMASLLGINTDRVIALTFVIGAAMAAVAGVFMGVQLELDGTKLVVDTASEIRWQWVFIGTAVVFFFQLLRPAFQKGLKSVSGPKFILPAIDGSTVKQKLFLVALLVLAVAWPFMVSRGTVDIATLTMIYIILGLGLNVVVGLSGLLVLGYGGFYAIGAYTFALLNHYYGLGFWTCLPIAGLMAAAAGFLLGFPVLRLRGDYLAIVTLGFGEIVRILLLNNTEITGGPNGISQIPKPTFFGLEFSRTAREGGWDTFSNFFGLKYDPSDRVIFLYLVALLLVVLSLFVINRLLRMPLGRAWEALREDEIACRSLGLSPRRIKLTAFTISAAFAGFAGTLFAARQGFVSPESFTFAESAFVLAIVVLGGMGSQFAVILAAILLVVSRELMRDFNEYSMLMLGGLMVLMMIWRPQGLLPMTRPQLKLKNGAAKGEQA
ncbi:TPA: high-affinity branched-chain amino acid ABC transporter permease LivH [Escherichia coli]|nr:high-affinity branched-chain amino acid ABC transporter permease LivH [Escherichia coli]